MWVISGEDPSDPRCVCCKPTRGKKERKQPPPPSHTHTKMAHTNNNKQTTTVLVVTLPSGRSLHPSPLRCCSGLSNCNSAPDNSRGGDDGGMVFWFFDDHLDDQPSIVGKQKNYRIGLSKFASHCVHRGRRSFQDWKDSTHMTTDCRVASVWVAAAHTNEKQETRTRSLQEAAACMKNSFVGSFFLSSKCFLEWWDCNVITLQVFLDFNFNRRISHNKKECHGFPPPSRYLLHS